MKRFTSLLVATLLALIAAFPARSQAQQVVAVPTSQPDLQTAIAAVPDGGIIEIATGTYTAPVGGFTLYDIPKAMTIRASAGAQVTLSGEGTHDIIRFANSDISAGRLVTFERITFSNGRTITDFLGGALTIVNAKAVFKDCTFQDNLGNAPFSGGGAQWINESEVYFENCVWSGNTSPNYGAGLSGLNSQIYIRGGQFLGNRVNIPGHIPNAPGGAIFVTQCKLQITTTRFEGNAAGYVGGAIYALGDWQSPSNLPSVDLEISNSSFINNNASRDGSVLFGNPTVGGAIHVEDQTTLRIYNCRFTNNTAQQGGAISNYRAITEIDGCVFQGNQVGGTGSADGIGGAIFAISPDLSDPSTGFGSINRPNAQLDVRNSVFIGAGNGSPDARQGGAIFALGDENAAYGLNGVQQNGSQESNHTIVNLRNVIFSDLTVADSGGILGTGGALTVHFTTLNATNSIFQNCAASGFGGAVEAIGGSTVTMTQNTIARCRAGLLGGGFLIFGGNLNISSSNFVQNQLTDTANGSAILISPLSGSGGIPDYEVAGMISDCVFANNSGGITVYDADRNAPPFNRVQYSGNTIFTTNENVAYHVDIANGSTVAELNQLVIQRSDGTTTVKSPSTPNVAPASAPIVQALLMDPPSVLQVGAPGENLPIPSYLAYASNGDSVTLDGQGQPNSSGIVATTADEVHTLNVGPSSISTQPLPSLTRNISTRLPAGTGQNVLIGGFIIQGSTPKRVMVRAVGPSLPLSGTLQNPFLELHDQTGALIAINDNWRDTQMIGVIDANQEMSIIATALAPSNDAESALIAYLQPGTYTTVVSGVSDTSGIAIVEAYDLDPIQDSTLANISTRGFVQTENDVMIGGFIMGGGTGTTRVVVRGIGPSLGALGIANPLIDPMLELYDLNGTLIDSNDSWRSNQAAIQPTGLQPSLDAEAALLLSNPAPGPYTAILKGKNGGTGVGVVEAYVF